jgi:hypothetical protein
MQLGPSFDTTLTIRTLAAEVEALKAQVAQLLPRPAPIATLESEPAPGPTSPPAHKRTGRIQ